MKKIDFVLTHPNELPFEALEYLQKALDKTPSNDSSLSEILEKSRIREGYIYVFHSEKVIGCTYVEFLPDIMNIVLLSGEIKNFKKEIKDFYIQIMRDRNISNLCVIGRRGWSSLFKDLQPIGMLYVFQDIGG